MADEQPRKRSRFDQAPDEADHPRKSRFDRRSRSPVAFKEAHEDARRTRSPVKSPATSAYGGGRKDDVAKDPAAIAAAAAARITAQLQQKKGVQHVDVPPIRTV